jgi:hypothetical protein
MPAARKGLPDISTAQPLLNLAVSVYSYAL